MVASLVEEFLSELGFAVVRAATAKAALDIAVADVGMFDIAIADLGLPDRSGQELIEDLRALRADLPIVVATGNEEAETQELFSGMTRLAVLRKPFAQEQLATAIAALTGK